MARVTAVAERDQVRHLVGSAHRAREQMVNVGIRRLEPDAAGHTAIAVTVQNLLPDHGPATGWHVQIKIPRL